jgi:hypothetical protein
MTLGLLLTHSFEHRSKLGTSGTFEDNSAHYRDNVCVCVYVCVCVLTRLLACLGPKVHNAVARSAQ